MAWAKNGAPKRNDYRRQYKAMTLEQLKIKRRQLVDRSLIGVSNAFRDLCYVDSLIEKMSK